MTVMAIERIIPDVQTADTAATVEFYRDFVGLVVDMEMPEDDFVMLSSAAVTSAQITINDNGFRGLPPGFAVDVGSSDVVTALHERAVAAGLRIVEPLDDKPWGIRRFSLLDPSGTRVTLIAHLE